MLSKVLGPTLPDILYDGIVDPKKQVDGKLPDALGVHIHDNGEAGFVNFDAPALAAAAVRDRKTAEYRPRLEGIRRHAAEPASRLDRGPEVIHRASLPRTPVARARAFAAWAVLVLLGRPGLRVAASLTSRAAPTAVAQARALRAAFAVSPVRRATPRPSGRREGVIPYDLNSALFSDYAEKYRFIKLPPRHPGQLQPRRGLRVSRRDRHRQDLRLPARRARPVAGRRLIETRILKREPDGWVGLPYIWNKEQTEATLDVAGDTVDVSWIHTDGRTRTDNYIIPNANQCKGCHKAGEIMRPIGPKARHLNRDFAYSEGTENQLTHWTRRGVLAGAPDPAAAPRLAVWDDPKSGTLDARARAWLEINCAHCHSPEGPARNSGLDLLASQQNPTVLRHQQASGGRRHRLGRPGFRHRPRPARQIDPRLSDRLDPPGHHDARIGQAARARRRRGPDPRVDRGDAGTTAKMTAKTRFTVNSQPPARRDQTILNVPELLPSVLRLKGSESSSVLGVAARGRGSGAS